MATYNSVGTGYSSSTASTSHSVNIPTHSSGDLLILFAANTAASQDPALATNTPTGWTLANDGTDNADQEAGNFSSVRVSVFWKEGNGSETSVSVPVASPGSALIAQVARVTSADTTSPVIAVEVAQQESGVNITAPASNTGTETNVVVVRAFVFDDDLSTDPNHDSNAGWNGTSRYYSEMATPGNGMAAAWAVDDQAGSGSVPSSVYSSNGDNDGGVALTVVFKDGAGISSVSPDEFDMDASSVNVNSASSSFDASGNDVYISDVSTLAGGANEVDISSAINTEAVGLINLNLTLLSSAELASLQTLGPGARYIIVDTASDEFSKAITLHRPHAFVMSLSSNFAPGATTVQLTAPATKATTDFDAGRIEEAANPTSSITITEDDYTEIELCFKGKTNAENASYLFRVTGGDIDTYTVTPQLTIIDAAGGGIIVVPKAMINHLLTR